MNFISVIITIHLHLQGATEYRIRRHDDNGEVWEIFSVYEADVRCEDDTQDTDPDDNSRFMSMGIFSTDEAKEYFNDVRFDISDEKWRQMGCRNLHRPEEQDCGGELAEDA